MCLRRFSRPSPEPRGTTLKAVLSRGYTPANSLLIKVTIICCRLVIHTFLTLNLKQHTYSISTDLWQDQNPIFLQNNKTEYKNLSCCSAVLGKELYRQFVKFSYAHTISADRLRISDSYPLEPGSCLFFVVLLCQQ